MELLILSGGITVTGRTPVALIRDKDSGNYFDFASRTFTGTTTSATAVLTSAIEGIYRYTWDISGLFAVNSGTKLTFEFHDATAAALQDVLITLRQTGGGGGGGGGIVEIKGLWTPKQKQKLFDAIDLLKEKSSTTIKLLRDLLGRKTLTGEDLQQITRLKERDLNMYQELLKILDLKNDVSEKVVFEKLQLYIQNEEEAKAKVIKKLDEFLKSKEVKKEEKVEDWPKYGDDE